MLALLMADCAALSAGAAAVGGALMALPALALLLMLLLQEGRINNRRRAVLARLPPGTSHPLAHVRHRRCVQGRAEPRHAARGGAPH